VIKVEHNHDELPTDEVCTNASKNRYEKMSSGVKKKVECGRNKLPTNEVWTNAATNLW
jgi:hypothetical protein